MSDALRLRADAARLRRYLRSKYGYDPWTWFLEPAWVCVLLHRWSHRAAMRGKGRAARFWMQLNSLVTGADIQPASDLGPGLLIPSPVGVTISCKAGPSLTVLALSGLGGNVPTRDVGAGPGLPLVGARVMLGQVTGVQGAITVGDDVVFYPGSGAVSSVPPGARMVPAVAPAAGPASPPRPPRAPDPPCRHDAWYATMAAWREDIAHTTREMMRLAHPGTPAPRVAGVVMTNPLLALLVYRLSHWLHRNGWRRAARGLAAINLLLHKLTIPPQTCLGGGVLIPHLAGLLVHGRAGRNLALFANVVCSCDGDAHTARSSLAPALGDDVMVGGHSGVFGPVTLGNGVQLGPKANVAMDISAGMQVWDPHARGTIHPPYYPPLGAAEDAVRLEPAPPWREAFRHMRRDRRRRRLQPGGAAPAFPGLVCTDLYRLAHACHRTGWLRLARWCTMANTYLTGADITPATIIAGGLLLPHPAGVALHGRAGQDLTVMAVAGFGSLLQDGGTLTPLEAAPRIGDRVLLAHHSGVFGPVTVGDGACLASGCFTNDDVPACATMLPRPLRVRDRRKVERLRAEATALRSEPAAPGG